MSNPETTISPKVTAVAAAGALVTLLVGVAKMFGHDLQLDPLILAPIVAALATIAGYLKPDPLRQ